MVGAELAAAGLEVEACDENVAEVDLSPVDLVGITCHVYNAPRAFALAAHFRRLRVPVILGGSFPTVAPGLCAAHADSVVVGELEGQAAALVADARAGRLRPVYRAAAPPSLARTLAPDLGLLDAGAYLRWNFPLEVTRGCRFACGFCTAATLFGPPRVRALADVERDLARHDHGLVELIDVNFLADAEAFAPVLPLLERAPIPGWMGQTTVADLTADDTLPARLARSRCRAVFVGLETIDPAGLRALHKSWSRPEDFLVVARRLAEVGILVQAGIIVGLDGESREGFDRTVDFLERARVQSATVTYLHHLPGTRAYQELADAGRLCSTELADYDGNHVTVRPRGLSVPALEAEVARFLRRLYTLSSIGRRAAHGGLLRHPTQALHHALLNGALRSYYGGLLAARDDPARRYRERPPTPGRLESTLADAGAWLLDRLWSGSL